MNEEYEGIFLSKCYFGVYSPPHFATILKLIIWKEIFLDTINCFYDNIKYMPEC